MEMQEMMLLSKIFFFLNLIFHCFLKNFFYFRYTFSSVFGPNVDQKKFFDTWVYDKVLRFLNGNNELLFAYGTTNAGKTYTIHGS